VTFKNQLQSPTEKSHIRENLFVFVKSENNRGPEGRRRLSLQISEPQRYLCHEILITDPNSSKRAYLFCVKLYMLPLVRAVTERAEYLALFRR
jgi:hypothetical protein